MDYIQAFAISAAGMSTERARVDVASLNLANADTVWTPDGINYQPLRVVSRAGVLEGASFAERVDRGLEAPALSQVVVPGATVEPAGNPPRRVHEPGNPFADAQGFVTYPGVDPATEMVSLMAALRAYEANVAAMNVSRTLALKALDIGGAT